MHGLHLTADLHGCPSDHAAMSDAALLRALCLREVEAAGLHPVGELFHRFAPAEPGAPSGVTGVVLLAESHLAVHTWPELRGVTLDVYVCNFSTDNRARAQALLDALVAALRPGRVERQRLQRGRLQAPVGLPGA
ncbi:adenosylmethionine decarboxylase [Caldimonas tepidiphila]|uniref:adenosylmethionine decarboxylase n=1 Tax=Caldimonas tepidiphila TaxID=2315841 RepID=UPI000E5C55D1|nr:adenosylmethionine decarboxylase [Caldimonas tepidiphila]